MHADKVTQFHVHSVHSDQNRSHMLEKLQGVRPRDKRIVMLLQNRAWGGSAQGEFPCHSALCALCIIVLYYSQ